MLMWNSSSKNICKSLELQSFWKRRKATLAPNDELEIASPRMMRVNVIPMNKPNNHECVLLVDTRMHLTLTLTHHPPIHPSNPTDVVRGSVVVVVIV
jgi:hypothetical protein